MDLARLLIGLLPASRLKNWLMTRSCRQWSVDPSAHVGPSVFWRVHTVRLEERARIGTANVFRSMRQVHLASDAEVGQFNWVSGFALHISGGVDSLRAVLRMEPGAALTARHYLDCSGGVVIGSFTTVAGVRSTILTHSIDIQTASQELKPVLIGDHCFISTGVVVTAGVTISDRVLVAAGATVTRDLDEVESMYGGVPAQKIRSIVGARFFSRRTPRNKPWETVKAQSHQAVSGSAPGAPGA